MFACALFRAAGASRAQRRDAVIESTRISAVNAAVTCSNRSVFTGPSSVKRRPSPCFATDISGSGALPQVCAEVQNIALHAVACRFAGQLVAKNPAEGSSAGPGHCVCKVTL
jgi:hypothetical protein